MDNNVKMAPAICTQCGGTVEVNKAEETAKCPFCGASFIIEKAINNYNVKYAHVEHADNVNIDVSGAVKDVLGFVGEQMEEGRQARKEERRIAAEKDKAINLAFLKIFGFMFGGMLVFALLAYIVMLILGGFSDDAEEEYDTGASSAYYSVMYVSISGAEIVDASEPVIVDSLSDYNYQ